LLQARATLDQEVDEVSRLLAAPVEAQLGNFLAELRSAVVTGASGKHIATSIFEFVDKQLRPGAAALAVDVKGEQTRLKSVTPGSMKFDSSIRKLSFGQSLSPLGAALLLASFYAPAYLLIYDLASASAAFTSLALAGVSCLLLGRLFRTSAHWTIWALFHGAIFGTCFFVSLPLAALTGGALEIDLVLPTALVSSVVVFALSSLESLLVRRAKLQTALQDLIAQLESTLRALETRLSVIRTKVSRQLHNDTQGKLVAVALRAGAVPTLDHAAAESILEELGQIDVRTSISMRDVKNFASRLAELRDFWSGALEIEWSASTEATKLLDLDSVLADRCVAILAEVLTNAAKYSSDGTVAVNLTESDGRLVLRASNPTSTAFGDSSPTGLGEASMREFTKSLSVTLVGGVFKLEAVL
jgi:signal transduction histidine kinase